jgi:hypothetical protein
VLLHAGICEKFALEASPPALHSDCIPGGRRSRVFKIGEFGQQGGRTISIVSLMIG